MLVEPPTLTLTDQEFHDLWDTVHRSRSTSKTCTFSKQAVVDMLIDHSRMYNVLFPTTPSPQRKEPQ